MDPVIFREYDIRAVYGKDLIDSDAYILGQAFGSMIFMFSINSLVDLDSL